MSRLLVGFVFLCVSTAALADPVCPPPFTSAVTPQGTTCYYAKPGFCAPGLVKVIFPGVGYECLANTACPHGTTRNANGECEAAACPEGTFPSTTCNPDGTLTTGCTPAYEQ